MNTREQDLAAALLWLRNHFDLNDFAPELKPEVLDRIDRVLADGPPTTGAMSTAFREKYPRKGTGTG